MCQQLDLLDIVRVAETCKGIRHGDGGLKTAEIPTKAPMVAVLCEREFLRRELVPRTRPAGCSESWVAYLARCIRQRFCREAPPIVAGKACSLFVDAAGQLLACGKGAAVGHGDAEIEYPVPAPVTVMARIRVRSVAAGQNHSLALSSDGRVYSWGTATGS